MRRTGEFKGVSVVVSSLLIAGWVQAQEVTPNLAERLGYPAESRLLIIHADDLGLAHSANRASFEALRAGAVSSGSVMMPCPWVPEVVEFQRENPDADVGLHLTLNSEWQWFKWGPAASRNQVPGLLDPFGYLWPGVEETLAHARPHEVETELRAQIELALKMGLRPTHLDNHMGTVVRSPEFLAVYLKLGREYNLPVFAARPWLDMAPYGRELIGALPEILDGMSGLYEDPGRDGWTEAYARMVRNLRPGVTQMIVHLAYDDAEMRRIAFDHPDFGSAWRQKDFETMMSSGFRELLEQEGVRLITWREIGRALGLTGRQP
ncbi:MAG TPA: polysaccharide deacetylase family protein [Acidobacteriota bacterium]|jgi:hypothetical protein|nr:polysaccharide deacetylase family protein [Acidobacteriota bacterium]HRR26717.1 polysaccharide deacetylase family protein [Acidobacteriota bacterium]HRV07639.1 polysaccharide deacetylase family protein [Acidobacteriota bacterium]